MSARVFRIYDLVVVPVGFVLGGLLYVVVAVLDEIYLQPQLRVPGTAYLSSGQEFGLMSLPLSCLLGAVQSWSVALAARKSFSIAAVSSGIAALLVAGQFAFWWADSHRRYGSDPSEVILYIVPLIGTGLVLLWSAAMCGLWSCTWWRS
jgi:hypothetical protein